MRRIPAWGYAVLLGVVGFVAVFKPWQVPGQRASDAARGLRDDSVYVAADAPGLVDPERAREVIGDRAIVVAIFDDGSLTEYAGEDRPSTALCEDVARLVPTNLVIVFASDEDGQYGSAYCDGPAFPGPTRGDASAEDFSFGVLVAAELSWQYRVTDTDLTAEIEEYVLTFDAEAAQAYGEIPRRGPVGDAMSLGRLLLAGAGMVSGTVVLFLLLRGAALALRGGSLTRRRHDLTARRRAADARLNRLADRVLQPRDQPDAEAAKEYVLALHAFREATDDQRLSEVESRIAALEGRLL